MKPAILIALWTALTLGVGFKLGERAWCRQLMLSAVDAEGFSGGARLRHAAIGGITNILIAPDHVEMHGPNGSRLWFP